MHHSPTSAGESTGSDDSASAARIAAGRRLESAIDSLHSALSAIVASALASSSPAQAFGLRRALAPVLPFVMLPLQLALAPKQRGGGGGGGERNDGGGGVRGAGGGGNMPAGVREKALLCVAEVVRGSGSLFVEVRASASSVSEILRVRGDNFRSVAEI